MTRGAYLLNLERVPYLEAWDLQRSLAAAVSQGAIPDTVHAPRASAGDHARAAHRGGRAPRSGGSRGRDRRDRPRRQVDVPRARPARLLPDLRPDAARPGRQALLPRPRGGADPHARGRRGRGDADRRPDRDLGRERADAEKDRVDRRPHHEVGDDARLRAERRPRHGALHRVDHRVRPRGRVVHDDRGGARRVRSRSTKSARTPRPRSRRSSTSPSRSCRPTKARASGRSRSTSS